jgi:alkanesulfonate monooxygenase SsuD/methylene tetrahydromethanopterin reductase-like flavin-dependent oxidoreductase (luciferase family)
MSHPFQLGLDTFGDVTVSPDGSLHSQGHTLRDVVAEAVLAERVGVDSFAVGVHHRPDFAISGTPGSCFCLWADCFTGL